MSQTIDQVFRDYKTQGVPASGDHEPDKREIRALLKMIQNQSGQAVTRNTLSALNGVTPPNENYMGVVLADPNPANNGYYSRVSGAWVKGRGFPDTFAVLTSVGGTANAITASTEAGVNPADILCVLLPDPPGTNSSATVTLTINGGSTESIKAASGANLAIGDIIEGVGTLFFKVGSEWRQLFSSATGATFDHQGDYAGGTTYTESQVVTGSDGKWYQLKDPSATGDDPVGSGTGAWLEILSSGGVADNSVSTIKIQDGAVTEPKLATGAATLAKIGDDAKADFRMVNPEGPRDTIVWAGAQTVLVEGTQWAMGGFRRKGKYVKARAPVFPSATFQNTMHMTSDLAHGMTAPKTENWYGAFAVANDSDANASFEVSPFLRARSVAGSVITLGKCGELADALGTLPTATYSWANNALVGAEVLVITEMFSALAWTMRVATVTANTTTTITLDDIGTVAAGSLLLLAPSGWDHYRYCSSFYYDSAEVRNMFDGGGGPVRCRMGGVNVVAAHGNDGAGNSTYLDGPVATGARKLVWSGFISPLATGVYFQSTFLIGSSSTELRAQIYFDMDGGVHTPELHDFVKDGVDQQAPYDSFFLTFKGDQICFPSTGGPSQSLVARVNFNVTGWWEP